MSKDGINSKDFIIGSLIGGIVGASAALLLAPKAGKELRVDLGSQANMVAEKTSKFKTDALGKSSEWANKAKDKTVSISQSVSSQSSQLMNKVKDIRGGSKTDELGTEQDPVSDEVSAIDELAEEAAVSSRTAAFESQEQVLQGTKELAEKEASKTTAEASGKL